MSISSALATPSDTAARAGAGSREEAVRAWIVLLACMVVLMVAVGGATRLTGSGLSITEWKPVTGAIPPLTHEAWLAEFAKYRDSSQYRNLNAGMELGEFKTIYWWEWGHRQLGRLLGVVFFGPLLWFWATGALRMRRALALLGIGALGGLQATVGWIMVASGLEPGMTAVAPVKLAIHLLLASVILAALVWMAAETGARLSRRERSRRRSRPGEGSASPERSRPSPGRPLPRALDLSLSGEAWAFAFLLLVLLQIGLGGLVAGSKAGLSYNTWPLMDGRLIPSARSLFSVRPWIENFVDNPALVQLNHRLMAYLTVAAALAQALVWRSRAPGSAGARSAIVVAALALAQAALGVATLLLAVPLWAGLAHQLLAMALLVAATLHARVASAARMLSSGHR